MLKFRKGSAVLIKCIALDMDGTLLNREDQVSVANKAAIEKAQAQGVEVVIATGRSFVEARHALDEADLKCSVISLNGAAVWDKEGKLVASNPMNIKDVKTTSEILDKASVFYEIYTNKGTFSRDRDYSVATIVDVILSAFPDLDPLHVSEKAQERFESGYVHEIESYSILLEDPEIEFYKILAFSSNLEDLGSAGGSIKEQTSLVVSSSGKENLEISSVEAQKGVALEKFVGIRNIALSETMAVGDSYNDVSMFEKVGKPVAMGNAVEEIKQLCGEVTLPNQEDGVAHAILKAIAE